TPTAAAPAAREVAAGRARDCDGVFGGWAAWGSCTSWSLHDAMELAKAGAPAGIITTTVFQGLALSEIGALGVAGLPLLVLEHPLGGERSEGVIRRARQAVDQLAALLRKADATGRPGVSEPASLVGGGSVGRAWTEGGRRETRAGSGTPDLPVASSDSAITVTDTPEAILAAFCEREWCDGLPIVPPTEERVRAMLGGAEPDRLLGVMPPLWRRVTLEKLAVNAVMAGCEPAAFPLVVAAVEAMLDPTFNLYGVQATTHSVAPLLIVHGPIADQLGVHGGSGCFRPGFRANATIGRAIRLILLNVRRAWPRPPDLATQGSPAKFSYCIAERRDAPWGPLHETSMVTVFGGEPPHNVNDHVSTTAAGILATVADTSVSLGSNVGWYFSESQLLIVL